MRIGRHARDQLAELIAVAAPLRGDFFRSVAFKYFHPDDVVSGEGTRLHGGRFVPIGVKARELAGVVAECLGGPQYSASQELATIWIAQGIESVIFPSVTGIGNNTVIYLANASPRSVAVRNRDEVLAALRRPRRARK